VKNIEKKATADAVEISTVAIMRASCNDSRLGTGAGERSRLEATTRIAMGSANGNRATDRHHCIGYLPSEDATEGHSWPCSIESPRLEPAVEIRLCRQNGDYVQRDFSPPDCDWRRWFPVLGKESLLSAACGYRPAVK
jgi:hypothetical protein